MPGAWDIQTSATEIDKLEIKGEILTKLLDHIEKCIKCGDCGEIDKIIQGVDD